MTAQSHQELVDKELRPSILSRRGEVTAWISTIVLIVGWLYLSTQEVSAHPLFLVLGIITLIMAIMISIGGWADRHTCIRIKEGCIVFENGLRVIELNWEQIEALDVFSTRMGKQVRVTGDGKHFNFRPFTEVQSMGKVKGSMGYKEGEALLEYIIDKAGLKLTDSSDSRDYYARV